MKNNFYKNSNSSEAGFTLIEVITAAFVFSIIAVLVTGIFTRATFMQRRAYAAQQIQDNTLFIIEAIARDARVSQICPTPANCNTTALEMDHPVRGIVRYSLDSQGSDSGSIDKSEGGDTATISSDEINFTRFNFITAGIGIDNRQAKVTLVISARNRHGPPLIVNMQTTVTTRDLLEEFLN